MLGEGVEPSTVVSHEQAMDVNTKITEVVAHCTDEVAST